MSDLQKPYHFGWHNSGAPVCPRRWYYEKDSNSLSAKVTCLSCNRTVSLSGKYAVAKNGLVSPDFHCAACGWNKPIILDDWNSDYDRPLEPNEIVYEEVVPGHGHTRRRGRCGVDVTTKDVEEQNRGAWGVRDVYVSEGRWRATSVDD